MSSSLAPATQVLPMPRATTAACDAWPPRAVRMPSATCMPWMSSGDVSTRTRITLRPAAAASAASSALKTTSPVAALEETRRLLELREAARHRLLERRIFARALLLADSLRRRPRDRRPLGELLRRANAGDDVLALRVAEEVAVEDTLAGRRVARERDAGRAVVAEVAEDH